MIISLIVAVSENNVIGKNNDLPWHLPTDMKYFRDVTMGHCVIMGRKNYDSIPLKYRPLDGRTNIVVTKQKDFKAEGCIVVNSIEEALKTAASSLKGEDNRNSSLQGGGQVFIIGGADIYRQTFDIADKIYYTKIHHSFDGDAFFPKLEESKWKLTSRKNMTTDEKNKYAFSYLVYEKLK
ncbi:MAG: dihydrofolate reductase [Bacteroidetes bacterium]|nr:dihydrofolate reductase [Bacteroidota bacterium]